MRKTAFSVLGAILAVVFLSSCDADVVEDSILLPVHERPNVLVIMVDDMGYADLGAFGSEIPTPNLDVLAMRGTRLSNFISSPVCSPSRAMLLTGVDSHLTGMGNLPSEMAPNQAGQPGYEGYLNERVVTIATLLQDAGYNTYMTGKWHLGMVDAASPAARGFDRSFAMMINASHFSDMQPAYSPDPDASAPYRDDDVLIDALPEDFEYSSQFHVDRLIQYLEDDRDSDVPFFAYLAFPAPHWPLQAPDAAIEEQRGRYDEGYDVIFERRLEAQRQMGLIPEDAIAPERAPKGMPWEELSDEQRQVEIRGMEVYAAMIAELDRHSGRLIDYLHDTGLLANTVVIFLSDNGAEGHDYDDTWPAEAFPEIRQVLDDSRDFSYENMGRPNSYTFYGPNWARVSSPAFRLYKAFTSEGGVRTAAFVFNPARIPEGEVNNDLILIKDLAATILDLAGVEHPGSEYQDRVIEPMTGISALGILTGESDSPNVRYQADEIMGKISVRYGDWKLLLLPEPYGTGDWQLYNLADDLAETQNLAEEYPGKVSELREYWEQYAEDNGVILPDWVSGY